MKFQKKIGGGGSVGGSVGVRLDVINEINLL